jgi:hypothetical protein
LVGCINCTDTLTCAECNATANYTLTSNNTCLLCTGGTFPNVTAGTCDFCTLTECTLCLSLTMCSTCNTTNLYYLNSGFTCSYCDPLLNNFINSTLNCETCSLFQCLNCSSLTTCTVCNATAGYALDTTTNLC